jgi:hypothetical protein
MAQLNVVIKALVDENKQLKTEVLRLKGQVVQAANKDVHV